MISRLEQLFELCHVTDNGIKEKWRKIIKEYSSVNSADYIKTVSKYLELHKEKLQNNPTLINWLVGQIRKENSALDPKKIKDTIISQMEN